ncbi:hypothetical protein PG988_013682 [Apiospora saccharicola]
MAPTTFPTVASDSHSASEPGPGAEIGFPDDAIAIVVAGCRLPGANNLEDLWDIISQGQTRLEKLRPERCNPKDSYRAIQDPAWIAKREFYGNFIDDVDAFDHSFFGISPREAAHMDPQQRLLLETAFQAMDSSGYLHDHQRERGDPVGCFIGASYTEPEETPIIISVRNERERQGAGLGDTIEVEQLDAARSEPIAHPGAESRAARADEVHVLQGRRRSWHRSPRCGGT